MLYIPLFSAGFRPYSTAHLYLPHHLLLGDFNSLFPASLLLNWLLIAHLNGIITLPFSCLTCLLTRLVLVGHWRVEVESVQYQIVVHTGTLLQYWSKTIVFKGWLVESVESLFCESEATSQLRLGLKKCRQRIAHLCHASDLHWRTTCIYIVNHFGQLCLGLYR